MDSAKLIAQELAAAVAANPALLTNEEELKNTILKIIESAAPQLTQDLIDGGTKCCTALFAKRKQKKDLEASAAKPRPITKKQKAKQ